MAATLSFIVQSKFIFLELKLASCNVYLFKSLFCFKYGDLVIGGFQYFLNQYVLNDFAAKWVFVISVDLI